MATSPTSQDGLDSDRGHFAPTSKVLCMQTYGQGFDTENSLGRGRVPEFLSVFVVSGCFPWVPGLVSYPPGLAHGVYVSVAVFLHGRAWFSFVSLCVLLWGTPAWV